MNKWKALAGSLVLGSALTTSGMVLAFPDGGEGHRGHKGHHGGGHHKERMFEHMAEKLDLTEGQKAQLKADREAGKESRKAARKEARELHKQLREAVASGADQATLDALGAKIGQMEVQKMQRMQQKRAQFESILTDEQKAKLDAMKAERKARHEERMERKKSDQD
ncbi:Spy/CpxP family protein refolding chaperone [uncultured Microbulbifer sp.]|uniref:Spy/CpxP family protein refolding chaperone n=1 Tax=uncultured Microbulbifer sp. TaxID=348147 RepID=UPI002624C095|nr:Spy/CpxP family protein refolding chaperone [uncultured Microbulbifer sp.]